MCVRNYILSCVLSAALLAGCSAAGSEDGRLGGFADLVASLKVVTAADLDAATARAKAGGDEIGAMCYPVIKKYVQQGPTGSDRVAGIFDAFEKARLAGSKIVSTDVPDDLRIACAPLFMDSRALALRIGAMVR